MKRRISAAFLALALCLGLAVPAFAAEGKTVTTSDGKFQLTNVVDTATVNAKGEDAEDLNGATVYLVKATGARLSLPGVENPEETANMGLSIFAVEDGALVHEDTVLGFWDDSFAEHELSEERQKADEAYFQDGMGDIRKVSITDPETDEALASILIAFVKEDYEPAPEETGKPEDPKPAAPEFTDVPEGIYFEEPVAWAVEKKITNGTEPTKFSPEDTCTQLQILTFLYRAVQSAEDPDFVPAGTDMISAAAWAVEKGMAGDSFDGNAPCTRSTAVNYIWQTFDKPEAEKKAEFTDVDADADYADAVDWAVANGITNGTDMEAGEFSPNVTCTRGQIVTFLHRAYVEEARLNAEK